MDDNDKNTRKRNKPQDDHKSSGEVSRSEVNLREVFKGALPRKNNENTLSDRFTARQKIIC